MTETTAKLYALDTNACIALINGNPPQVRQRFKEALAAGAEICVSTLVAFELWYGVAKGKRREFNAERVEAFFAGPVQLWTLEDDDARAAGEVRAQLEATGQPIGAYDTLIAGQARQRGVTLVTANTGEFSRVPGLIVDDWGKELVRVPHA